MLAIGAVEDHALGRDAVDVRAVDVGFTVAAKFGPQVIGDDEKDVRWVLKWGGMEGGNASCERGNEQRECSIRSGFHARMSGENLMDGFVRLLQET